MIKFLNGLTAQELLVGDVIISGPLRIPVTQVAELSVKLDLDWTSNAVVDLILLQPDIKIERRIKSMVIKDEAEKSVVLQAIARHTQNYSGDFENMPWSVKIEQRGYGVLAELQGEARNAFRSDCWEGNINTGAECPVQVVIREGFISFEIEEHE